MKMVWSKNYYSSFSLCMEDYEMYKYSCVLSELLAYKRLMGMCRWSGWGWIFTSGLTITGSHFQESY